MQLQYNVELAIFNYWLPTQDWKVLNNIVENLVIDRKKCNYLSGTYNMTRYQIIT